jgi:hypothetical protein
MSYGIIASAVAGALFVAYITPKHEIRIVHPAAAQDQDSQAGKRHDTLYRACPEQRLHVRHIERRLTHN